MSENSTTEAENILSSLLPKILTTSTNSTQILLSYTDEIQEILKTFNDNKEILQITKFLLCIKNIAMQTKN